MGIIMIRLQLSTRQLSGKNFLLFTPDMERLDWLVVNRSSLDEPVVIPSDYFKGKDGITTFKGDLV